MSPAAFCEMIAATSVRSLTGWPSRRMMASPDLQAGFGFAGIRRYRLDYGRLVQNYAQYATLFFRRRGRPANEALVKFFVELFDCAGQAVFRAVGGQPTRHVAALGLGLGNLAEDLLVFGPT